MRKKNQSSLSSKYWLLILSIICILLMGLSLITDKVNGPLRAVANYTIIPMQNGINTVGMWMSDLTKNLETLKELQAENNALHLQPAAMYIISHFGSDNPNLYEYQSW